MYAIVEIAGKQYKVEKDSTISVDRIESAENAEMVFDKVLFLSDNGSVTVGSPYVQGAKVTATFIGEKKGDKVRGVKFKKRKNYTRTKGHRRVFSQFKISDISA
jgi:large subunit ribosomal protein L21